MKKEIKPYSKKKTIILSVICIAAFALATVFLLTGAIMQSNGVQSAIYLPFCIVSFPIYIATLVFLIYHSKGIMMRNIEEQFGKSLKEDKNYEVFKDVDFNIEQAFLLNKFRFLDEGYLYKKKFTFNKDFINYYVKKTTSFNLDQTIDYEFEQFDKCAFKRSNRCFILFIEMDQINEEDFDIVSKISSVFIAYESVPALILDTALIFLLNRLDGNAYLIKPGKNKLSLYNYGFKFVKKILKNPKSSDNY